MRTVWDRSPRRPGGSGAASRLTGMVIALALLVLGGLAAATAPRVLCHDRAAA